MIYLSKVMTRNPRKRRDFPFSMPLFHDGLTVEFDSPVTIIVGDNGSGKSTLLETLALCSGFNVKGGTRDHCYNKGPQDNLLLANDTKLVWSRHTARGFFLRSESFLNFIDYYDEVANSDYAQLSRGESFIKLISEGFSDGLYILDEPEAALSPQKLLAFLSTMSALVKADKAQFIIATHNPMIMAFPNAQVLYIEDGEMTKQDYKDTLHFQLMKRFFADPEAFYKKMID